MMGLHITVVVLALGGSFSELLSRLLALGTNNALTWMASKFNLDDWDVMTDSTDNGNVVNDMIGWRTLQMIDVAMSGLLLWIDAVEFLFLSGIFIILAFSIRTDNQLFGMRWAKFGLVLAILGIIDFITAILRFEKWGLFSTVGGLINTFNQLILFPIWLIWLGRQLPKAEEVRNAAKNTAAAVTESSDSMLT
jgi:TctA family transporter